MNKAQISGFCIAPIIFWTCGPQSAKSASMSCLEVVTTHFSESQVLRELNATTVRVSEGDWVYLREGV